VELFEISPWLLLVGTAVLGLVVGSFLNVVVYRVPIMMEMAWREQMEELATEAFEPPPHERDKGFNLWWPPSACTTCGTRITALHNIPVVSYLILKGRCAHCGARVSTRYPIVEACVAIASVIVAWRFGAGLACLAALGFSWTLIALALIDVDRQWLPDSLTLPLLWAGLLVSLVETDGGVLFADLSSSVLGAVAGYLILWSVYHLFKLVTGREGMGYGDFKLLAALGAWLGWQMLPLIVLLSATVGSAVGITMIVAGRRSRSATIPFGPYLAAAGWAAMLFGEDLIAMYTELFA
jgi:leader peptidase (prepilin peptidase)/N-methyltransferase